MTLTLVPKERNTDVKYENSITGTYHETVKAIAKMFGRQTDRTKTICPLSIDARGIKMYGSCK